MSYDKNFVIAHLSDLHLTASDDLFRSNPRVFGSLKGMNETFRKIINCKQVKEANLVVVTGDVTDRGDIESWRVFWKAIDETDLIEKVLVVPGNHDVCCLGARLPFKKIAHRETDLEKANNGLQIGKQERIFPWVREYGGKVVIFGLNSSNSGNFSVLSNAMGRIGHNQLTGLAQLLYIHRNVPVKIVALHHSPDIPEKASSHRRGRRMMRRLIRTGRKIPRNQCRTLLLLCLSHGVKAIIHGHVHLAEERVLSGVRIIGAPPTTQPKKKSNKGNLYQFYTYTIQDDNGPIVTKLKTIEL